MSFDRAISRMIWYLPSVFVDRGNAFPPLKTGSLFRHPD
jgi:hypothetical protein